MAADVNHCIKDYTVRLNLEHERLMLMLCISVVCAYRSLGQTARDFLKCFNHLFIFFNCVVVPMILYVVN